MQALTGFHASRARRRRLGEDDRAGAAVAFGAAFLGAGEPPVLAQVLEQRGLRRDAVDGHGLAVEQEAQGSVRGCRRMTLPRAIER